MRSSHRTILFRAGIILLICVVAIVAALSFIDQSWQARYREKREEGNREFMNEGLVEWQGEKYRKKPALSVFLLAGVDKAETEAVGTRANRYRNGGQADFLLLLAVDHGEKQIHQLQIDRDTMAEVTILGVYGNETGTRQLQICLAHNFGARSEDNAKYTVRAVKGLMDGVDIDGYYMVDYASVPALADALDGVPVTIPEDMTSVNPEWFEGHTVTLRGSDAETFVRTRKTVGEGTNQERMTRQGIFMRSAITRLRQQLAQNQDFGSDLIKTMKKIATTNLSDQALLTELSEAAKYEVLPIDYLPGKSVLGENGLVEFYPEEGSPTSWIMNHLYAKR